MEALQILKLEGGGKMIETLQVSELQGGVLANPNPVDGYYHEAATDTYWYIYTDPTTGITHHYRYEVAAADYVYALSTRWVAAPKTIEMTVGDTLKIYADFYYVGPVFSGKLYGAIGQRAIGGIFNEVIHNSISLSLPKCDTSTRFQDKYVQIPITTALASGDYAIYIKITDGVSLELDKTLSSYYENAVRIVGVEPTFTEFAIKDYVKV